jgi:hypothetical protein
MRSRIDDGPGGLSIAIPMRRSIWSLVFTPLGLVVWIALVVDASRRSAILAPGFGLWAFLAFAVVTTVVPWLWDFAGRERVMADAGRISVRQELFGLGWTRDYDAADVKRLRVSLEPTAPNSYRRRGRSIAFDYGAKTVRFAPVDEAEARSIVQMLASRLRIVPELDSVVDEPEPPYEPDSPEAAGFWARDR